MQNYELAEFTAGVYGAREQVMARLGEQAAQHGASGIVGVRIGHTIQPPGRWAAPTARAAAW